MILYGTVQTIQRYGLTTADQFSGPAAQIAKSVIDSETGKGLLEWGMKLFYFDGRKCIQLVNFASKFTLFLFDIKKKEMQDIGNVLANYLLKLFQEDPAVCACLERLFSQHPIILVAPLKNRSIIATLNHNQIDYAFDGQRFWSYIEKGMMHSLKINHDFNFGYPVSRMINGRREYYFAGELFRELLLDQYG